MRKALGSLVVVLVIVVIVGMFRGWFGITSEQHSPDDKRARISVDVDKDKIADDAAAAREKAARIADKIKEGTK